MANWRRGEDLLPMEMIPGADADDKLIGLEAAGDSELELRFSDGSHGAWSAAALIARDTELSRLLADPAYFRRAFIEAGALAWPNGLELSADGLHRRLAEAGTLVREAA